jgi:hypothetical protein
MALNILKIKKISTAPHFEEGHADRTKANQTDTIQGNFGRQHIDTEYLPACIDRHVAAVGRVSAA